MAKPQPDSTSPQLPAAVLWDMDGTLVDTEPFWIAAERAVVAEYGSGTWSESDSLQMVGQAIDHVAEILQQRAGVDLPTSEIVSQIIGRVRRDMLDGVAWQPGARELLAQLADANIPCALVTMSYRQLADTVLLHAPGGAISVVVTGDEVSRGKPDPEPYLRAARELGVDPAACVAVEDSLPGLASAEGAGARTLAVQHVVEIPPHPGRSRTDSLTRITLDDLRTIAAGGVIDHLA